MNKIAFLLLLTLQVGARGYSQQVSLSLHKAPLQQVFKEVKKQTGYVFFYDDALLQQAGSVTVFLQQVPLKAALDSCFKGQPFTWEIVNTSIYLRGKRAGGANIGQLSVFTKSQPVLGKVMDHTGNPLPMATVKLLPLRKGTITDENGNFIFESVAPGEYTLEITSIGFENFILQIEVAPDRPQNLGLLPMRLAVAKLTEIAVVNTGYQRLPRERAAGSFSVVKQATLDKRSNYNIQTYLEGQVPGLLTNSDGSMTIRGQSTLRADKAPLIVVDGFPIERDLSTINPNDVESITVLKDASAASIWGVRAANGVIVIQTKRGASSRKSLDVSFNASLSLSAKPDFSQLPFASTTSFIGFEKYKVDNHLVTLFGKPRNAISPITDAYLNNPATADQLADSLSRNNAYQQFDDLFMRNAVRQQYGVTLAAKGEKSTSRASFNYDNVPSYMKRTGDERFSVDLFQTVALTKKLHTNVGLNYVMVNSTNNGMTLDDLRSLLPYQQLLDGNGNYIPQPQSFYQADKEALVKAGYPYNWDYNLVQEFRNHNNRTQNRGITAVAGLTYMISKHFDFNTSYQYENYSSTNTVLENEESYDVRNQVNFATYVKNGQMISGLPKGSIYSLAESKLQTHTLRNQLKFDGMIGSPKHLLIAIAGLEIRQVAANAGSQTKYGYDPQTLQYANLDYVNGYTNILGNKSYIRDGAVFADTLNRFVSLFSNAGYTFDDKYSINASARLDQTNLFGSSDKYRNVWLWSSGVSWQAHKESFLEDGPFSTLILRATYGINGNVDRSTSPFLITKVAKDAQTNLNYGYISNPANPLLRWEKTTVTNIGIDYTLRSNRLRGSVEYYNRYSTDLLGNATINGTYGFNSAYVNYASLRNKGVDVNIAALIINRQFTFTTTLNYSYNSNKVVKVDFPDQSVGAFVAGLPQAGMPLNYVSSYRWAGLSNTGAPQVYDEKNAAVDYTKEMNNTAALIYQGTTTPPHYGGLFLDFGYKGFTLTAGFIYKMGHQFRIPQMQYTPLFGSVNQVHKDWDNRWQQPGDELLTNIPAMPKSQTGLNVYDNYTRYADINVATASTIRFQELLLNYVLPEKLSSKLSSSRINLALQARNLGVYLFNKQKIDPEHATDISISNIQFTPPAELTFSIKANF
ncbi:SusC/RagA family TonB-linked outer membrane protein [Chitinophaga sp.]|uniref:SusC/RagA family TonB-linked outer membrane protein n=1 Tax=Chitinophaga sp. TaxID=1869181 RepID=UPI002F95A13E